VLFRRYRLALGQPRRPWSVSADREEGLQRTAILEQFFDERFAGFGRSELHLRGLMSLLDLESARQRFWGPKLFVLPLTYRQGRIFATLREADEKSHGAVSDRLYERRLHNIASDRECAE
jgi:hypothetical protein